MDTTVTENVTGIKIRKASFSVNVAQPALGRARHAALVPTRQHSIPSSRAVRLSGHGAQSPLTVLQRFLLLPIAHPSRSGAILCTDFLLSLTDCSNASRSTAASLSCLFSPNTIFPSSASHSHPAISEKTVCQLQVISGADAR